MLINRGHQRFIWHVKAIPGKFIHALVIADIDKRKIKKVVEKTCAGRRKLNLPPKNVIMKRLKKKVIKLVDVGA